MDDNRVGRDTLISLTSDLVAAHLSNNSVEIGAVPGLISSVYQALASLGSSETLPETGRDPAVPLRASVKKDHLVCLDCGKKMKMIKRHLRTEHGLTPEDYRHRWALPPDYPMVASDYAEARRSIALDFGLGRSTAKRQTEKKK